MRGITALALIVLGGVLLFGPRQVPRRSLREREAPAPEPLHRYTQAELRTIFLENWEPPAVYN